MSIGIANQIVAAAQLPIVAAQNGALFVTAATRATVCAQDDYGHRATH